MLRTVENDSIQSLVEAISPIWYLLPYCYCWSSLKSEVIFAKNHEEEEEGVLSKYYRCSHHSNLHTSKIWKSMWFFLLINTIVPPNMDRRKKCLRLCIHDYLEETFCSLHMGFGIILRAMCQIWDRWDLLEKKECGKETIMNPQSFLILEKEPRRF